MADRPSGGADRGGMTAVLGPTNTGKTHLAVERLLSHRTGAIGLPLRLLAREVYDRVTARIGERRVALVTGEEKRVPPRPDYWVCTVESMPVDRDLDFVCVDEIQLASHRQRGHTFTDRILHARGVEETWFLGADTMRPVVEALLPTAAIRSQPRFSKLSYSGSHGIGSLPPRTAIVAFSAGEVYELAERVRHRHGGTAVVLGALSPRTRNAQVAMYEAGEVHYMVATDAIGMGLNLDLDRVVFASLDKFDGREARGLDDAEMAQIAGRAGRYTRDGEFGVLKPIPALDPKRVESIEHSRLRPVDRVVWRNSDLEFGSIDELVASLRRRPPRPMLQLVEQADDYDALLALSRLEGVRARAHGPEAVELLWEVCRIPDFRKLLLDSHVELLARIYEQLAAPGGKIDVDWMARRIGRLEDSSGDIETLMGRIAFVRTWTYITNHERWVPDAVHWQERTRAIEDRHSDALHQRLTERFVARESTAVVPVRGRHRAPTPKRPVAVPVDPHHPFGRLAALALTQAPEASSGPTDVEWVQSIEDAPHAALSISDDLRGIAFEGEVLGRLAQGPDIVHPQISTRHLEVGAGAQRRIHRRLTAWVRDAVDELVRGLDGSRARLSGAARGLAYQLVRGLGTLDVRVARDQLAGLTDADREALRSHGIVVGRQSVHVAGTVRPERARLRAALWSAFAGREPPVQPPPPSRVAMLVDPSLEPEDYVHLGYLVRGPVAVRCDQLEKVVAELEALAVASESFELPPRLGARLGCKTGQLPAVLSALGYARLHRAAKGEAGDRYGRRTRTSRRRRGRR